MSPTYADAILAVIGADPNVKRSDVYSMVIERLGLVEKNLRSNFPTEVQVRNKVSNYRRSIGTKDPNRGTKRQRDTRRVEVRDVILCMHLCDPRFSAILHHCVRPISPRSIEIKLCRIFRAPFALATATIKTGCMMICTISTDVVSTSCPFRDRCTVKIQYFAVLTKT